MGVAVHHGDCLEVMRRLIDDGVIVQSCVCDPPYHLSSIVKRFGADNAAPAKSNGASGVYGRASSGFMGQKWDGGDIAFRPETWRLVYDLLPPGGHLLAFSGTRTYHRMVCAIEDARFEIRDQIGWLFGSGFPKSHNQKGDWLGWGTALKPAWEPIVLARKPLDRTVPATLAAHGTGAINIHATKVGTEQRTNPPAGNKPGGNSLDMSVYGMPENAAAKAACGRWPANIIHDGSDEVETAFAEFGEKPTSGSVVKRRLSGADRNGNRSAAYGAESRPAGTVSPSHPGTGSASRFFYCAKAGADDRWGAKHPTVKPVSLMRWLVRLVTPPNGTVLDPFAGTGTTGVAALAEGFNAILIERDDTFVSDIRTRLDHLNGHGKHSAVQRQRHKEPESAGPLFEGEQ